MSIRLSQLLNLSHHLNHGRKRRCEWEDDAERRCRRHVDDSCVHSHVNEPTSSPVIAPSFADCGNLHETARRDITEIQFLGSSLEVRSLEPRTPDAEMAFLLLLSAAAQEPSMACASETDGSDFDWLAEGSHEAPVSAVLGGKNFKSANFAKEARLNEALARLCGLMHACRDASCCTEEPERDEEAAALRELSDEAMFVAEREELAMMLSEERMTPPLASSEMYSVRKTTSPDPSTCSASAKNTPALLPSRVSHHGCATLQVLELDEDTSHRKGADIEVCGSVAREVC